MFWFVLQQPHCLSLIAFPTCAVITCPPLPDHPYGNITYSPDNTPPYLFGTQAKYVTVCPEGLERSGGDDVKTCTGDSSSPLGQWNGTAPVCTSKIAYQYPKCTVSHNFFSFSCI